MDSFLAAMAERASDTARASLLGLGLLPTDVLVSICLQLGPADLGVAALLSSSFRVAASSAFSYWRLILGDDGALCRSRRGDVGTQMSRLAPASCSTLAAMRASAPLEATVNLDPLAVASHLGYSLLLPLRNYRATDGDDLESSVRRRCLPLPTGIKSKWVHDATVMRGCEGAGYPWLLPRPWMCRLVGYAVAARPSADSHVLQRQLERVLNAVPESAHGAGHGIVLVEVPQCELDADNRGAEALRVPTRLATSRRAASALATLRALHSSGYAQIVLCPQDAAMGPQLLAEFRVAAAGDGTHSDLASVCISLWPAVPTARSVACV